MASNRFTISPIAGTGNGSVVVTPSAVNDTYDDIEATVVISNGGLSKSVAVRHYGKPSVSGSTSISAPYSGSSYAFTIKTHYAVRFQNLPEWITIDDGQGNYISNSTTILPSVADGRTYNLNVLPNGTNSGRTASFGMYHYYPSTAVSGTLSQESVQFSVQQPQGEGTDFLYFTISESSLDWDDTNSKGIAFSANVPYSIYQSNDSEFNLNGGNGYVSVGAKDSNTGSTLKTTTIYLESTKPSYPMTATCVVTQFRQPSIARIGDGTIPPTGGSAYVTVVSDYYWWIYPPVKPDASGYITMTDKVQGVNMQPCTASTSYELVWDANTDLGKTDQLHIGYIKADGSTSGVSSSYAEFNQQPVSSDALSVSPSRIPAGSGYVSSGGGVYYLQVVTDIPEREWHLNGPPMYCTVVPTAYTGSTQVEVTVNPNGGNGRNETFRFVYNTGSGNEWKEVYMFQEAAYVQSYIEVIPEKYSVSAERSLSECQFAVSANTAWTASTQDSWIAISRSSTDGDAGYSDGLSFIVVASNTGSTVREGSIVITGGTASATLAVSQDAASWGASEHNFSLSSGATGSQSPSTTITADSSWSAQTSDSWIHILTSSGNAGSTQMFFYVDSNSTGSRRNGEIDIISGGETKVKIYVEQDA